MAPEQREVVRRRERGDRDQDQVVEQDRPACDEAPQLVEAVARQHGRAAALLVQRRALHVGKSTSSTKNSVACEQHYPREAERVRGRRRRARSRARPRGSPGRSPASGGDPVPRLNDSGCSSRSSPAHRRRSTQSRPAPAATNSTPKTIPVASGPPPAAIVRTRIVDS